MTYDESERMDHDDHEEDKQAESMICPSISLEMIYEDEPFLDRINHVADHGFDTVEFATWFDSPSDDDGRTARRDGN